MGDQSSVEVDAVVKNTVKSQERRNGASITLHWGQKEEEEKIFLYCYQCLFNFSPVQTLSWIKGLIAETGPNLILYRSQHD